MIWIEWSNALRRLFGDDFLECLADRSEVGIYDYYQSSSDLTDRIAIPNFIKLAICVPGYSALHRTY